MEQKSSVALHQNKKRVDKGKVCEITFYGDAGARKKNKPL
jgi:hypothetical protein